jgi:peroxiredoxin
MMKRLGLIALLTIFALLGCSTEKPAKLKIGDPAPDFLIEDSAGGKITLSAFKNRPVIIRFFITDCKFCKADTPVFNDYFEEHKDRGLMILYLTTTTDQQKVSEFATDLGIPFPVAIDYDGKVSKLYNINVKPQTIVLGSDHLIRGAILGGVSEAELDEMLAGELAD